jgi:hypothetical protein
MSQRTDPHFVISVTTNVVNAETDEELAFYGINTIRHLIKCWKQEQDGCSWDIDELQIDKEKAVARKDLRSLSELEDRERKAIERKSQLAKKVRYLEEISKIAEKKPALPSQRPDKWFSKDDDIMWCAAIIGAPVLAYDYEFTYDYEIIRGRIFHCWGSSLDVTPDEFDLIYKICSNHCQDNLSPYVMHCWEYEYLLAHEDFRKLWLYDATWMMGDPDKEKFVKCFENEVFLERDLP